MKNYKIRVNSGAESKEAQELFEKIGYEKGACGTGKYPATIIAVTKSMHRDTPFSSEATRLNHDAHKDYIELDFKQLRALVAEKDGFISGKESLIALANGDEVEVKITTVGKWVLISELDGYRVKDMVSNLHEDKFRIKPRTVKLEIEVPAPFEPEFDERFFFIDSNYPDGFNFSFWQGRLEEKCRSQFGVYRTEKEIKIVVEQLRKLGALR